MMIPKKLRDDIEYFERCYKVAKNRILSHGLTPEDIACVTSCAPFRPPTKEDIDRIRETAPKVKFNRKRFEQTLHDNNCSYKRYYICYPAVTNVIFNYPATIVFWDDGTKTVVKCNENEDSFDPEKGFAMAVTKKYFGNKGNYYNHVRAALEKYHPSADLFDMIAKVIDDVMKGINGHEK